MYFRLAVQGLERIMAAGKDDKRLECPEKMTLLYFNSRTRYTVNTTGQRF